MTISPEFQLAADLHSLIDSRFESATRAYLESHPDACTACTESLLDDAHADPYFHLNFDDYYNDDDIDPIDILATMLAITDDEFLTRYSESLDFLNAECRNDPTSCYNYECD